MDPSATDPSTVDAPSTADAPSPRWTVSIDPLTAALGFLHLQVEAALSPHVSLYLTPTVHPFGDYTGFGAEAGLRVFPLAKGGPAPRGMWLMARGHLAALSAEGTRSAGGWGSGLVGYTWYARPRDPEHVRPRLLLSGGAGLQYISTVVGPAGFKGVFPALHTAVGVAFR